MKFQQFKFWLVAGVLFLAACAGESATKTANTSSTVNNTAAANPVVNTTVTPANVSTKREPDVPYVPTREMVVDEMLKMAEVKGDDVLYDLGSGDGRIPITTAKEYGARGVGIDINPERVKDANENARKAGVTDKVKFIKSDIFETDFSKATVVTLYLLPEVNLKLRPKLREQLKPGMRIISHAFDIGDWKPEQTVALDGSTIYF